MSRLGALDAREARVLTRVQRLGDRRALRNGALALSSAGEHAWLWLAVAGGGFLTDPRRRSRWGEVGTAVVLAHGSAAVLKRLVRRRRPHAPGLVVLDTTPSDPSFPSAHAASTTAAAVAAAPLLGWPVTAPVAVAMAAARMLVGVHYPSDVSAGALLGVLSARGVRRVAGALA